MAGTEQRSSPDESIRSISVTSKGQVTITAGARRTLGIDRGTHLLEIVVGECIVLVPEHAQINRLLASLGEQLRRADLTVEQLIADMDAHRAEVVAEFYPSGETTSGSAP